MCLVLKSSVILLRCVWGRLPSTAKPLREPQFPRAAACACLTFCLFLWRTWTSELAKVHDQFLLEARADRTAPHHRSCSHKTGLVCKISEDSCGRHRQRPGSNITCGLHSVTSTANWSYRNVGRHLVKRSWCFILACKLNVDCRVHKLLPVDPLWAV